MSVNICWQQDKIQQFVHIISDRQTCDVKTSCYKYTRTSLNYYSTINVYIVYSTNFIQIVIEQFDKHPPEMGQLCKSIKCIKTSVTYTGTV